MAWRIKPNLRSNCIEVFCGVAADVWTGDVECDTARSALFLLGMEWINVSSLNKPQTEIKRCLMCKILCGKFFLIKGLEEEIL